MTTLSRVELREELILKDYEYHTASGRMTFFAYDTLGFEMALKALNDRQAKMLKKNKIYKKDYEAMSQALNDMNDLLIQLDMMHNTYRFNFDEISEAGVVNHNTTNDMEQVNNYHLFYGALEMYKKALRCNFYYKRAISTIRILENNA